MSDSAVTNDNLSSIHLTIADAANPSFNLERLPEETAKVDSLDEPSAQEQPVFSDIKKIRMESDCSVPQLNRHSVSFLARSESSNEKSLCNSELSLDTGWVVLKDDLVLSFLFFFLSFIVYDSFYVLYASAD